MADESILSKSKKQKFNFCYVLKGSVTFSRQNFNFLEKHGDAIYFFPIKKLHLVGAYVDLGMAFKRPRN